ncbi:MAG TPA: pirin family protein [Candidatus Wallbacteria bacterium]|nr:pirin family protein [Candidatus Wallbacteria bacterium]
MSDMRTIRKVITGTRTSDGAGVRLVRVFGYHDTKEFDPFLMLDAFDSTNPDDYVKGFPWHPHRGIETITYLIKGRIEHGDSLGNKGEILDGCCQWMTAGSGIIHQEMPKPSERMLGVQLWLNLSAKNKMTAPEYNDITEDKVPVIEDGDCTLRVIAGNFKGRPGAFEGRFIKPLFFDAELKPGREWSFDCDAESNLFVYIIEGAGRFAAESGELIPEKHAVLFNKGKTFHVKASDNGVRFLLLSAKQLKEPVAWGGPIVMNTKEELELAFKELNENKFIKYPH